MFACSKGLHNFTHPRTDPVVIMIAVDETHDKILLGRGVSFIKLHISFYLKKIKQRKFPIKYYSGFAGFIEPGESLEDSVARETLEEAGVYVWDIKFHSEQLWVINNLQNSRPHGSPSLLAISLQSTDWVLRKRRFYKTRPSRSR